MLRITLTCTRRFVKKTPPTGRSALTLIQTVRALWDLPYIKDSDVPLAIHVPPAAWHAQKAIGDSPKLFCIGRRLFVRTSDLRAWLDKKADAGQPGNRRLRAAANKSGGDPLE